MPCASSADGSLMGWREGGGPNGTLVLEDRWVFGLLGLPGFSDHSSLPHFLNTAHFSTTTTHGKLLLTFFVLINLWYRFLQVVLIVCLLGLHCLFVCLHLSFSVFEFLGSVGWCLILI